MVDYVRAREMTSKKFCKYCVYGSFEYLLCACPILAIPSLVSYSSEKLPLLIILVLVCNTISVSSVYSLQIPPFFLL